MIHSIEDWRDELNSTDAELILLLRRRMQLAVELLRLFRGEHLTLGDLEDDVNRLGIFLYAEIGEPISGPLDKHSLQEIFRRIIMEQKRLARSFNEDDDVRESRSRDAKA